MLDLFGGIASQREEDEIRQSVHGLPRGDKDLEKAGIHITGLGDAGEMLDDQAKVSYRHRLSELREELGEAKEPVERIRKFLGRGCITMSESYVIRCNKVIPIA